MLNLTWCLRRYFSTSTTRFRDKEFLDSLLLCVQGGTGGKGSPSTGGQGGDGGSVFLRGARSSNLEKVEKNFADVGIVRAEDGKNSGTGRLLGDSGADLVIPVPIGISVSTRKGNGVGAIDRPGQVLRVAEGGQGGGPRNGFRARKSPFRYVRLDLKLVADVGLVGFPNAGKSTLLTRLSNATPKIAAYPFTTLRPQLGIVTSEAEERSALLIGRKPRRITVADLPGLVEGASRNVGLGHEFLKHVERTKVLLFVVDAGGFYYGTQDLPEFRDPFQTICLLCEELERYDASLLRRPALLCVNKVEDAAGVDAVRRLVAQLNDFDAAFDAAFPASAEAASEAERLRPMPKLAFTRVHAISAKEGINVKAVVDDLISLVLDGDDDEAAEEEEEEEEEDKKRKPVGDSAKGR